MDFLPYVGIQEKELNFDLPSHSLCYDFFFKGPEASSHFLKLFSLGIKKTSHIYMISNRKTLFLSISKDQRMLGGGVFRQEMVECLRLTKRHCILCQ